MSEKANLLHLRLFIEGVEVPCVSAQVAAAPNSPLTASIQIIPLVEGSKFLPRTLVHLFFLDLYQATNPYVKHTGYSPKKPGPTTYEKELAVGYPEGYDTKLEQYKLLFVGEVLGFQLSKGVTNRSLILHCVDLSNYWDYAYQFNGSDLFGPGHHAMFSGQSANLVTNFLDSSEAAITRLLHTPPARYPTMKGLLGGMIHILEAIGGSYYYDKQYAGSNMFFSIAELRLHITQLIAAFERDPTYTNLIGSGFDSMFSRVIGALGDQVSYRNVISKLSSSIFHEVFPQPCPMYVPGTSGTVSGFEYKKVKEIPELVSLLSKADGISSDVNKLGSSIAEFNKKKLALSPKTQQEWLASIKELKVTADQSARLSEEAVPGVRKRFGSKAITICRSACRIFQVVSSKLAALSSTVKYSKGNKRIPSVYSSYVSAISKELGKLKELNVNITKNGKALPALLKQQIFRPDVWFSAPIRCNVLFPDNYTAFNYQRAFMQEPTRLLLKTHDEFFGEDELFDHFYFAPKAITLKGQKNTLSAILNNDILDHELFTGIIPVFEKLGEFTIFAAKSGVLDGKVPKVGMAQRATNFMYFKHRFAARQMSITARFNPYLACGFPGLLIDKYMDLETLRLHNEFKQALPDGENFQTKIPNMLGTHFLANFTEITHVIDQSQGVTNINCSYPRETDETVEFLGVEQEDIHGYRYGNKNSKSTVTTTVASLNKPVVGTIGPSGGKITEVANVTSKYVKKVGSDLLIPLFGGKRDQKTKQLKERVAVGVSHPAKDYGKTVIGLVGDPELSVAFEAYAVTETKQRSYDTTIYLPPEEYIRPGWFGDCWHPSQISEPYYDFFGIGAITEQTQISREGYEGGPFVSSSANESLSKIKNEPMHFAREQMIKLSQTKNVSVSDAVALLVLTYSAIKHNDLDADNFIRSYTWRPIASLLDMFGSSDLSLDKDGKEVESGFEGFHSRAFGNYNDLFGLVTPDIENIVGIARNSVQSQRGDVRKRRRQVVLDYVSILKLSKAILG